MTIKQDDKLKEFLTTVCFKEPTKEALDLAQTVWNHLISEHAQMKKDLDKFRSDKRYLEIRTKYLKCASERKYMKSDLIEITKLMNHLIKNDMLYSQLVTRTVNEVLEIASKYKDK